MTKKTNKNYYFIKKPTVFLLTMLSSSVAFSGNSNDYGFLNKNFINNIITNEVTGVVTDTNGQPLPGATVFIKGTNKGTQTDFDGRFILDVKEGDIIAISYVGYETQEILFNGQQTLNVSLKEETNSLNEVVVIGYGTKKRSSLTTAISSVKSEELTALPAATINEALEGRAAGVQVRSSGSPGEDSQVVIRGLNTFGNGSPLYVVDGVFVQSLSQINPASIEKVDVLKDAAATAIYGSRASNGVVIISTKKGKIGKPKFTFSTYTGIQKLSSGKGLDLLSGPDLVEVLKEVDTDNTVAGNQTNPRIDDPNFIPSNTNWIDEIFNTAPITNFDLGVSGGSENARYSVQAGIFNQDGIQLDTNFKRYTFNTNSEIKLGSRFKIGQTLNLGYSKTIRPEERGGRSQIIWSQDVPQYLPIRGADGRFVSASRNLDEVQGDAFNPIVIQNSQSNLDIKSTILGSFYGEAKLFEGLTNRVQVGVDLFNFERDTQQDKFGSEFVEGDVNSLTKILKKDRDSRLVTTFTNILNYNKIFGGDHNVDASLIFERVDTRFKTLSLTDSSELPNSIDQLTSAGDTSVVTTEFLPDTLLSYVARASYSFQNKYILSGSIRRDTSSKFARPEGIFRAGSLAWVVSNESFLDSNEVITNLKLRAGFGETGNNNINPFIFIPVLKPDSNIVLPGGISTGISTGTFLDENITWEKSIKTNFGVDFSLLNDRITFTGDYFLSDSEDLLAFNPPPASSGLQGQVENVGKVDSRGFEITLGYNDYEGDFKWSFWGAFSSVRSEVKQVTSDTEGKREGLSSNAFGSGNSLNLNLLQVGEPVYVFRGLETDGIYQDVSEIVSGAPNTPAFRQASTGATVVRQQADGEFVRDASGNFIYLESGTNTVVPLNDVTVDENSGTGVGDLKFRDQNGDGVIDDDDVVVIGDPNPDFTYSFNLSAEYKGFDASIFASGVQGVDVINVVKVPSLAFNGVKNFDTSILNRYTPTNTNTNVPRYASNDPNKNITASDRFIEDGSYLRIKTITLGYSLPKNVLSNFFGESLSKLRFYISANNAITFTKYSGLDPEIRPSYDVEGLIQGLGADTGFSPTPATYLGGIQVEF